MARQSNLNIVKKKLADLGFTQDNLENKTIDELEALLALTVEAKDMLETAENPQVPQNLQTTKVINTSNAPQDEDTDPPNPIVTIPADNLIEASEATVTNKIDNTGTDLPSISDPGWTEYVLSSLMDYEKDNGSPKTDGLRRIATKLLGVFSSQTDILQTPTVENGFRASVKVELTFHNNRFSTTGAADVYSGNTKAKFATHAVATAETRAEGRALRKALRLTKVLAAEELTGPDADEPTGADGRANTGMLNGLRIMANKIGKTLLQCAEMNRITIGSEEDLTTDQGLRLSNWINKVQRGEIQL